MEKLLKINIYFDFYGKLLTPKQYQIIELYYLNDYSLTEIAECLDITRQGV
ncbi:MAG TPA: sigma factor-like helix-turn-helix DNA-binding protein, partial [Tissierellaceae bacterium]|nr:sigma factor-like helix-turn-helix DNA-binding protein [Tissierellaceae bacterium]